MIYFDSSYIIKCYLAEPGTPQVLHVLNAAKYFGLIPRNVIT